MNERNYWLGFSGFPVIGPARFRKLLDKFGTAKNAWNSARRRLAEVIGEETAEKFDSFKKEFSIEKYVKKLKEKDVWFITLQDEEYPKFLKQIKNPPFVLYGKGDREFFARQPRVSDDAQLQSFDNQSLNSASLSKSRLQPEPKPTFSSSESGLPRPTIAVVGARKTTQYGREVTKLLTTELVLSGFTIVSGLALGVDAISHMTALENNGKTIAVLGCGVDCCNPRENQSLYNSILSSPRGEAGSGNCIISEFPLGMSPAQWTFPARNRIIAGLSQAVLVTEGTEDSGSLITAEFALKFGRKVFAVPGPITSSMSKGPYKLISKGAKLVTSGEDILKELKIPNSPQRQGSAGQAKSKIQKGQTKEERKILDLLQNEALHFDEIVRKTEFKSSKLSSTLSLMEIKGMIKSLDGRLYSI